MIQVSRYEQETTIRFNAEEQTAYVCTNNPATVRKLDKLASECPEAYRCTRADPLYGTKWHEVTNKRLVRFGKPASEERRAQSRAVASRLHSTARNAVREQDKTMAEPSDGYL